MPLPSILHVPRRRRQGRTSPEQDTASGSKEANTYTSRTTPAPDAIKRATKIRRWTVAAACLAYFLTFVFLLMVVIGNTHNQPVLSSLWFYRLDLSDIIPTSVPNASLINSIAQTIGLHDFYQVGLWNFCEGYNYVGITSCSPPQTLYWFNPVDVLMSELLAGATIALPQEVITILDVLRLASRLMFAFFLTATLLAPVLLLPLSPLALRSRWWSLPLALLAALEALLALAAAAIATAISAAFSYAATAQSELNIRAQIGRPALVLMWLAAAFGALAFVLHAGMGCCCASLRDVDAGRPGGRGGVVDAGTETAEEPATS